MRSSRAAKVAGGREASSACEPKTLCYDRVFVAFRACRGPDVRPARVASTRTGSGLRRFVRAGVVWNAAAMPGLARMTVRPSRIANDAGAMRADPCANAQRLGAAGPLRIIAPCDRTHARWVREVTELTVVVSPK